MNPIERIMKKHIKQKFIHRQGSGYPEERQFLRHSFALEATWDLGSIIEKIIFRLTRKGYRPRWKSFFFNPFNSSTFLGFNTIRIDSRPFIVFFETTLPRGLRKGGLLFRLQEIALKSKRCKAIIAISHCAKELQAQEQIAHKEILVLHPPQILNIAPDWKERFNAPKSINFCFIGRDFARKGGIEILRAFNNIKSKNWHLTIISNLSLDDYATQYTEREQKQLQNEITSILSEQEAQIEIHKSLPNSAVLEKIQNCHVGLLPTWHDTYGYSVLEFQSCACPVITTDIRALPEINNDSCGWVIPVGERFGAQITPLGDKGTRMEFSLMVQNQLEEIIEDIIANPEKLLPRGINAVKRIQNEHDPAAHQEQLIKIINWQ